MKNYSAAAAIASPESLAYQERLNEINRRLMKTTTANLRLCRDSGPAVANLEAEKMKKGKDPVKCREDCSVQTWDYCMFPIDDVVTEPIEIEREVDNAIERRWKESAAWTDEQFRRIEDRLVELEEEREITKMTFVELKEESEMRERLLLSAIQEGFKKFEEEGERRETRIKKLEEEQEKREALLRSTLEEVVSLKSRLLREEAKNDVAAVAGKSKNGGWMKWIPVAVVVAVVGAAVVAKTSK